MHVLDVGGGFEDSHFEMMAYPLRDAIAHEFPSGGVTVIAEPGRFYASGFYTMVCRVIGRRTQASHVKQPDMLYLNDGIYGCFSNAWAEGEVFSPTLIEMPRGESSAVTRKRTPHRYSIWGPTCDSIDRISEDVIIDQEVKVGDWLRFGDMGGESKISTREKPGADNNLISVYNLDSDPLQRIL